MKTNGKLCNNFPLFLCVLCALCGELLPETGTDKRRDALLCVCTVHATQITMEIPMQSNYQLIQFAFGHWRRLGVEVAGKTPYLRTVHQATARVIAIRKHAP